MNWFIFIFMYNTNMCNVLYQWNTYYKYFMTTAFNNNNNNSKSSLKSLWPLRVLMNTKHWILGEYGIYIYILITCYKWSVLSNLKPNVWSAVTTRVSNLVTENWTKRLFSKVYHEFVIQGQSTVLCVDINLKYPSTSSVWNEYKNKIYQNIKSVYRI